MIDVSAPPADFILAHALDVIKDTYGASVYYKPKLLTKFGRFNALGTAYQTVQEHGDTEVMLTENLIDTVVSSDAGDTQSIIIEGHTIDGSGNLTFTVQAATLTGLTEVTLATPLARATRIKNASATSFAGTVTVKDTSTGTVYVTAGGAFNRSQKAATSVSRNDYWVLTKVYGGVLVKTPASVDFSLQVREQGGVFQEVYGFGSASGSASVPHSFDVPIIVPANSDVRIQAKASASGVEVVARTAGLLALNYGDT